jgi:hypothetical protein
MIAHLTTAYCLFAAHQKIRYVHPLLLITATGYSREQSGNRETGNTHQQSRVWEPRFSLFGTVF